MPGARWLTILMNRIDPALFAAAAGRAPLHLVSAFATTSRLVLGQEAVADKQGDARVIPALIERLAEKGGLAGALVTIDAVATNATVAAAICDAGADYLLAVKANQPTLRAEVEALFAEADAQDPRRDNPASSSAARSPPGTPNTDYRSSQPQHVNPDSEPCRPAASSGLIPGPR